MKVKHVVKVIGGFLSRNERVILTTVTITAELVAIYEGLKQGPVFEKIAEEIREKKENGEVIDKAAVAKKCAVPVLKIGVPFIISSGAAILNHKKASDAIQSVTGLYMLAKEGRDAYKEQVAKELGEEKAEEFEHEANAARYGKDMASGLAVSKVYNTGHGNYKFYDEFSGRYFLSDANYIEKVVNELNHRLNEGYEHRECILLNEFYGEIGLPGIEVGDDNMWNSDTGLIQYYIDWESDDTNQPLGTLKFKNGPTMVRW